MIHTTRSLAHVLPLAFLLLSFSACNPQPPPTFEPSLIAPSARPSFTQPVPPVAQVATQAVPTLLPSLTKPAPSETVDITPTQSQTPTFPTINFANPSFVVVAKNLPGPDDLALAPDGSIYFSDVVAGVIEQLSADGVLKVIIKGLGAPEGILFLPDGSLLIAEQGMNRLDRYDFRTDSLSTFMELPNLTGREGVDGLALDTRPGHPAAIIIPDSPNGKILRASLDGKNFTTIASGFARPTGAWVEQDGSLLVVDENANRLVRVHPDGALENLADLPVPDDVVEDSSGVIYVACLGDNAVHVLSASGQPFASLAGVLSAPQGLLFTADGSLLVTDPGHYRIIKFISG